MELPEHFRFWSEYSDDELDDDDEDYQMKIQMIREEMELEVKD